MGLISIPKHSPTPRKDAIKNLKNDDAPQASATDAVASEEPTEAARWEKSLEFAKKPTDRDWGPMACIRFWISGKLAEVGPQNYASTMCDPDHMLECLFAHRLH